MAFLLSLAPMRPRPPWPQIRFDDIIRLSSVVSPARRAIGRLPFAAAALGKQQTPEPAGRAHKAEGAQAPEVARVH